MCFTHLKALSLTAAVNKNGRDYTFSSSSRGRSNQNNENCRENYILNPIVQGCNKLNYIVSKVTN